MTPTEEALVERFVRYPASLSDLQRQQVIQLLAGDRTANEIADYYRAFYEELDDVPSPTKNCRPPLATPSS